MNPKLLKRPARKPRTEGKRYVYYPKSVLRNDAIPNGASVFTTSLCEEDGTIEVRHDRSLFRVLLSDLCEK
jgi:hypothetical protein